MNDSPLDPLRDAQSNTAPRSSMAWISHTMIAVCAIVFAFFNLATEAPFFESIEYSLIPANIDIWAGAYWGLITSAFVHIEIWHIAFNLWWLRYFGVELEPTMGRTRYLLFIFAAAFVSSGVQLALSDQTGIGFSGVLYAMFGYALAARHVERRYGHIVDSSTIQWLLAWLVLCIVLTVIEVWNVGNCAHIGGFLFGYSAGNAFVARKHVLYNFLGLGVLAIFAGLSMVYMPWSEAWRMRGAIAEYLTVVERAESGDPEAQFQYAYALLAAEDKAEGVSWLRKSISQGYVPAMNGLAWILATDPDASFRDGTGAVWLANQACEHDDWHTPAYIDTLAAAYAEDEQWEEAVTTQRLAIEKLASTDHGAKARYDSRLQKYLIQQNVRDNQ